MSESSSTEKKNAYVVQDLEKENLDTGYSIDNVSRVETAAPDSQSDTHKSRWQNFKDSFKPVELEELDPNLTEAEKIAVATARSPLQRDLTPFAIQMISLGGAIGTGLFVGSGNSLRTGGPAGILIGYGISGTFIYTMIVAAGELAVTFPISGGIVTYPTRMVEESFGFALAFNYMFQWLVVLPLELVAASITVNYWGTPDRYRDGFVALFYLVVVCINLFGVKGYGMAECVFSMIKVTTVVGFIILGIILTCGGGPVKGYIGGKYFHALPLVGDTEGERFKGVMSVFVSAAFAFAGSELVGLAAAETKDPRRALPKAAKQTFWRITLFYMLSLLMVGLLVPYTNPRLIGSSSADATASPFVLAIETHGIKGLPSLINVVILISVLSVGNSAVFGCSRSLCAMAEQGFIPHWFRYIDRSGRPLVGIITTCTFGLLCFLAASPKEGLVFDWLYAIAGLSSLFTWFSIMLCHIRFRRALSAQNRSTDELSYLAPTGVWGSYYGCFIIFLVLVAQFWIAVWPTGTKPNANDFFQQYLSLPVVLFMYIVHKLWRRDWTIFIRAKDIDIDTGRRETDLEALKAELAEERAILAAKPIWYRVYKFWC
ncbi:probable General amino-acid permease GAP1 [Saccharomycodes ludwigii]|uniref:Probable General amino-acid permease GAP1 n=1 Tax=Saccharomycodes ludwigii TaxID=36035 RepID=A0A376B8F9_9ASCO|nr:hypothetical protein SCDLUD_003637 [Saccharomycodes ludwigii]KAH3900641.1 hypothetical protein SCDLUD_003637 [Saccharomycodes ludwigii]SSD60958.1 probable General amino-acid permease GAP1 [Saccharomycodes ludwigii]